MGQVLPCCKEEDTQKTNQATTKPARNTQTKQKNIKQKTSRQSSTPKPVQKDNSKITRLRAQDTPKSDKDPVSKPSKYQHLRVLGKGSFGMVVLVEQKSTSKKYAMKLMPKAKITELNLLQSVRLPQIRNHPFLVGICETFQFNENIYIVMEYLSKGDLYFYTNKQGIELPESTIKNVLAEIIVGMEYLHRQGIVYRQLKPENILITDEGHIKLTDYAFSKLLTTEANNGISTFVGAIEYMAPQIIKGVFGEKADIWALGIVAYELKFRENPVEHQGQVYYSFEEYQDLLKKNFIQEKVNSKIGHMSHQFRELLIQLLEQDPNIRLSLSELRSHPFFECIDWSQVQQRTNSAPLCEIIKNNDYIKFRDPTSEQSMRKDVLKRHHKHAHNFAVKLVEINVEK